MKKWARANYMPNKPLYEGKPYVTAGEEHLMFSKKAAQEDAASLPVYNCVSCGAEYDVDYIFDSNDEIPICTKCGKTVRPDVVLYGEFLPDVAYGNAVDMMNRADCLIIGGTSLEVGSASQLAHLFHGKHLVIINKGKTRLEGRADLVFHDSIGKILGQL